MDLALFLDSAKVFTSFTDAFGFRFASLTDGFALRSKEETLSYELEKAVQLFRHIGLDVDVRVLNYAPLGFQFNFTFFLSVSYDGTFLFLFTKGSLLFTKDERLHQEFVERVWMEYMDFNFLSREILREALLSKPSF